MNCPNCGRDYFESETILENGEIGCGCMEKYTCRHCGQSFDTLYLGLTKHIQETHQEKYNFDADIKPYFEEAIMEERHIRPQISPSERKARRRLFIGIVGASIFITLIATYAVMTTAGDVPIIAGITALVWVAWIILSGLIIKGLVE